MVIERPFRHRGYAQQSLVLLADYALHQLHLHQLYVCVAANNEPALSLFNHAGYDNSIVLRDWLYDGSHYQDAIVMQRLLANAVETPNK